MKHEEGPVWVPPGSGLGKATQAGNQTESLKRQGDVLGLGLEYGLRNLVQIHQSSEMRLLPEASHSLDETRQRGLGMQLLLGSEES